MGIIDVVHDRAWKVWHTKAEKRAMQDPVYAEIQGRRHDGDRRSLIWIDSDVGLGWEEWQTQMEIFRRINPWPWWQTLYASYREWRPSVQWARAVTFVQRGRRGWANSDLYDLDTWLTQVISSSVPAFAKVTKSHPGTITPEEWDRILAEIAAGFALDKDPDDPADEEQHQAKRRKAQQLFAEWFDHLWS